MEKKLLLTLCLLSTLCASSDVTFAKMSSQSNSLYNRAMLQEQEGNYTQALNYIQQALQYSPDDAALNIKLAGLYVNLGRQNEAIEAYKKAITLRGDDGFLYVSLANLYMQKYDYQNALLAYEKAQSLLPDYKYNYINIANAKILSGDSRGAIESYEEFLKAYPDSLEALCGIANIYLEYKNYQKSVEYFALALRTNPKDFRDYANYGLALLRKEDYTKAEIAFQSAIGVNPNDSFSYANLAIVQTKMGKAETALAAYQKALELDNQMHSIRFDYAYLLAQNSRIDEAIEQYNLYIANYPESPNAYLNLASLYSQKKEFASAVEVLLKAHHINPGSQEITLALGRAYQDSASFDEALNCYNDVLMKDKTNAVALYNAAIIKSQKGQYQEASNIYDKLLTIDTATLEKDKIYAEDVQNDISQNLLSMAQELQSQEDYKKARQIYLKLLETDKENYKIYAGLADCAFALNMKTSAKDYYEKAIQFNNQNSLALQKYAQVLYELKDYETAMGVLDKAIEIDRVDDKIIYNKALMEYEIQKYDDSIYDVKKAIAINGEDADYYYLLALSYDALGKTKDAIYAFERFIDLTDNEDLKRQIQDKVKALYDSLVEE